MEKYEFFYFNYSILSNELILKSNTNYILDFAYNDTTLSTTEIIRSLCNEWVVETLSELMGFDLSSSEMKDVNTLSMLLDKGSFKNIIRYEV